MASRSDLSDLKTLHDVIGAIHLLSSEIGRLEFIGVSRDAIRQELVGVRQIVAKSGWMSRLQSWPRGYPGDFETVEQLLTCQNLEPCGTIGYWVEHASLHSSMAQQHRNKVRVQMQLMTDTIMASTSPASILVLAAGGAPDVRRLQAVIARHAARVVLNDSDPDALAFAISHFDSIRDQITTIEGNVIKSIGQFVKQGPFDLVFAGGLFDYLPDKHAVFLIKNIVERLLKPTGRFFFTNIARPNPYRWYIEYLGDWFLIERTEEDMQRLAKSARVAPNQIQLTRDETDLAWLATIDAGP